jgi:threonine/homoserine/homoserine lactone efflux protein
VPEASTLLLFAGASLALLVVPGPAVIYIVSRSLEQGRAAGATSVLGVHMGSLVHVAAAALGLSAVLASSAAAFSTVKYLGAAYLIFLGVHRLRRRGGARPLPGVAVRRSRLLREGVVVSVLNPKTALFFLAFLPQFVDPGRGPIAVQVVLLGLCFVALGMLSDGAYAVAAGSAGARLRRFAAGRRLDRLSGAVYLGLGTAAALATDRPRAA